MIKLILFIVLLFSFQYILIGKTALSPKTDNENLIKKRGQKVLTTARNIVFKQRKIIVGSCWDFVNAVYNSAGYPYGKRKNVFFDKRRRTFAPVSMIRPGDWLMHINLEYNNVEHSSIFVRWINRRKKLAQTIAYAGMKRREAGGYARHRLSKVFGLARPGKPTYRRRRSNKRQRQKGKLVINKRKYRYRIRRLKSKREKKNYKKAIKKYNKINKTREILKSDFFK